MKTEQITPERHELGMRAARRRAEYELGDGSWAAVIIAAYLNPEADGEVLRAEQAD